MVNIIAEVCQNHGGSKEVLGQMITAAAQAGADYVKMQSIFSSDLSHRERFDEGEVDEDGVTQVIKRPYQAEKERLSQLDLTEAEHLFFIEECVRNNVIPFTTVFSRIRIPFVASLPWPEKVVKVASYDCASYPMLEELCQHFDHLIISTGATYDEEIQKAAELVKAKGKKLTLLHCVTSYPNTLDMCNLARMEWLKQFTDSVGWSDHTLIERDGILATKAAIALGAEWIERHFTINEENTAKDDPVSIRPHHITELKTFASLPKEEQMQAVSDEMIGSQTRELTHAEALNRDYYRGRFASFINNEWIYNWEEKPVFTTSTNA